MGNVTSELTNNIKAQVDDSFGDKHPLFKLVCISGDGELVRLIKAAYYAKNYENIDFVIKTRVVKYLFNEGKGENVPIEKLVLHRCPNKEKFKRQIPTSAFNLVKVAETKRFFNTKEVCFGIEHRGPVGETLLHLCLLNGTFFHNELAKRLIMHYPKMVNDIYISDEFYGESALHIAIVNEDPAMVKFLLLNGANVHQRCCGRFFCPDDQKNSREDVLLSECPSLPIETNYQGYFYYGEYPLSFAALLNQEECVRLLTACGAEPNRQDSNGNTVLHMLVIQNNLKMFKLMMEFYSDLTVRNRQNLTPFTLAAKLARKEIFEYILEVNREIYWVYANIACAAYKLTDVDTIDDDGSTNNHSALHLAVNGDSEDHLNLLDGFLIDLLNKKWDNFIKVRFYRELSFYSVYFLLFSICLIMKRNYHNYLINNGINNSESCIDNEKYFSRLKTKCDCAYLYPNDSERYTRTILEITIVLYAMCFLSSKLHELIIQKMSVYLEMLLNNFSKILFIVSLLCVILIIPMRLTCKPFTEDILLVLSLIFASTYFFYFGRGFRVLGTFVSIFLQILKRDLTRFMIIYAVFLIGFSQAFYLVFETYLEKNNVENSGSSTITEEVFNTPIQSIMDMFVMSLGDVIIIYDNLMEAPNSAVGKVLFIIYLIIVSLLLVNMLIAMMTNTYDKTNEHKREWIRQWAKIVLAIEQNVNIKERIKQKKRYSHLLSNGEKALIVRWKQNVNERNDFLLEKFIFRKNIENIITKTNNF